jgi:hypothetical protein
MKAVNKRRTTVDERTTTDVGDYLQRLLDKIIDGLPAFLGALAVFLLGYLVAKALERIVQSGLNSMNLNRRLYNGQGGNLIRRAVPDPADLIGKIVFWVVFVLGISIAIAVLGVPVLNDFLRAVYGYLPNVAAALLIFMVASAISAALATLVSNTMGDTPTGKVVGTAAPVLVMSIATFMILNQLRIAPAIVTITYAALLGSVALGMALAFGLGGRDVAATMLQGMYRKSLESREQVRSDLRKGADTARVKVRRARP